MSLTIPTTPASPDTGWVSLPSGWSKSLARGGVGYVIPQDDGAYWWVALKDRTLIEGPAVSPSAGRAEVLLAEAELLR